MVQERGDHRIEPALFAELDRQALAQVSGADARRLKCLQIAENPLHLFDPDIEPLGKLGRVTTQVARFVDHIDKVEPDHPLLRGRPGQAELLFKKCPKAWLFRRCKVAGRKLASRRRRSWD